MSRVSQERRKTSAYFRLLEACRQPGCPICGILADSTRKYFNDLLYENVNDGAMRTHLRRTLGFCAEHSEILLASGSALGVAIIYQDLLQTVAERLDAGGNHIVASDPCPACADRLEFEQMYVRLMAGSLDVPEMADALAGSGGLCLQHLHQVHAAVTSGATRASLLQWASGAIETLRQRLRLFLRKQSIEYMKEPLVPGERDACKNAIEYMVGRTG